MNSGKSVRGLLAAVALLASGISHAAYTAYMYQNGPNVEVTGSGSFNTSALTLIGGGGMLSPQMKASAAVLAFGATGYSYFQGVTGPTSFGPSNITMLGSSQSGQQTGVSGIGGTIIVPTGYVSGTALSGGAIWNGATLAGLGVTAGTYTWNWGAGPTADSFTLRITSGPPANVTATKTVSGSFDVGSAATYTVILSNSGIGTQQDNPGNEFTDVLPAGVTLVSTNATSGTAVASVGANTVTWNGSIPAGGSVTLTIVATVKPAAAGTVVMNQGTVAYDSNGDGTNDASSLTDDPSVGGATDPTGFTIAASPTIAPAAIPTLSEWALLGLSSILAMFGIARVRRRQR